MNRREATSPITPDPSRYKRHLAGTIDSSPPLWPNEKFGEDQDTEMVDVEYENEGVASEPELPNTVDSDPKLPDARYRAPEESSEPELPMTVESPDDSDPELPDASSPAPYTFDTPPPIPAAFTRTEVTPAPSSLKHITNAKTPRPRARPPPLATHPGNIGIFLSLQPILPKNITLSWNDAGTSLYIRDHDLPERKGTVAVRFHEGWVTYVGIVQNAPAMGSKKKEEERDDGRSWWEKMRELRKLLGLRVGELGKGLEGVFKE
ncbi:hypothetical protein K440DRAFT_643339 [Wilcoxina mikolae CBS 423.85]|nr:hypothetical protein K440DRAFT_643339 [Wilcoxina mikolae CBS 423.85]